MRTALVFLFIIIVAVAAPASEPPADPGLEQLGHWMTGSFSSEIQSIEDDDFHHIVLHMSRIWPDRNDGIWLYVEQAVASAAEKPYRQRVYHVRRVGEGLFASSVFTFANPLERAGVWKKESPLSDLSRDDLQARQGCTIYLEQRADSFFEGSTLGRLCTSSLRGANWASSEVVIGPDSVLSWDRGWDDAGVQVWGAEKAGYRFDRQ